VVDDNQFSTYFYHNIIIKNKNPIKMLSCKQIIFSGTVASLTLGTVLLIGGVYSGGAFFLIGGIVGASILVIQKLKNRNPFRT